MDRTTWWREYARWQAGKREGPICVRCGTTIPKERYRTLTGLCEDCEGAE